MGRDILLVDDDDLLRFFLGTVLREAGYLVEEARSGREGLAKLNRHPFPLVITDLKMSDVSGLEFLRRGRSERPDARWIVITAYGTIDGAVEAMKAGASDYLTKPLKDPEELRRVVGRVLKEAQAEARIALLSEELGQHFPPAEMIFLGEGMESVRRLVEEVAPTSASVLVTGPSGTGKELVARLVHALSPRREGPFVAVHCAALTEGLLESELFGHERGAFTGAVGSRKGRFELADGGTIFLDEIGEIAPSIQVKLLRVLQEREFERVGGAARVQVDVRVVSATNRDLKAEMAAGRFREDLYYRLNVFPVALPPLAERGDAVVPLAGYFAEKYGRTLGKEIRGFTPAGLAALRNYPWPGNVRELQNAVERAAILCKGEIDAVHLGLDPSFPSAGGRGEGLLQAGERETIRRTLTEVGGNRRKAAALLGISLRTLQYRVKEYGL